jgi:hypothetical protein
VSPRRLRNRSRTNDLLLLSLGATVGVVAGALLIDRLGGVDRLLGRVRRRRPAADALPADDTPEAPYGLHDADGGYEDEYDDADAFDEATASEHAVDAADTEDDSVEVLLAGPRSGSGARARRVIPDVLTLEARVLEAFHNDPILRERAIDIGAIAPGVIELTGWVYGDDEIKHAITLARGVIDVEHVVNQLAVRTPRRNRRATDRLAGSPDSTLAAD